jgi:hypothetical protein
MKETEELSRLETGRKKYWNGPAKRHCCGGQGLLQAVVPTIHDDDDDERHIQEYSSRGMKVTTQLHQVPRSITMELYLCSPLHLHGVVLN